MSNQLFDASVWEEFDFNCDESDSDFWETCALEVDATDGASSSSVSACFEESESDSKK